MIKPVITAALVLVSLPCCASGEDKAPVQRLYAELVWELDSFQNSGVFRKRSERVVTAGSFWVVSLPGTKSKERVLVTAAHNLGMGPTLPAKVNDRIIGPRNKLISVTVKPVLGTLAYGVTEVAEAGGDLDVIFLRPENNVVLEESTAMKLAAKSPKRGEKVTAHGFPGTAFSKAKETLVDGFSANNDYAILNDKLDPGYSGGVILNSAHEAVGLVVSTDDKQSTVLLLTPRVLADLKWKPFKDVQPRRF